MDDTTNSGVNAKAPDGSLFLYKQPEYLSPQNHGKLGWTTPDKPFAFTQEIMSVPLVASEISSAQKNYPVVFSSLENAVPMAVVSIIKNQNMFVDTNGHWETNCYIPSYLRRHPFAAAKGEGKQFSVVIDRSCPAITNNPEFPFFNGQVLTERTQAIVDFCGQFEAESTRTMEFTTRLAELGLLTEQHATVPDKEGNERQVASFFAVDKDKFTALAADELCAFHKSGYLSFIYAHLFSLENWARLVTRSNIMATRPNGS